MSAILFKSQSLCIILILFTGIYYRRSRKRHVPLMLTALIWDVILVLQIELSRGAILKASQVTTNPLMLNIHVSFAVSTIFIYLLVAYTGRKLLMGKDDIRSIHKKIGWTAITLRLLTFITSFLIEIK